jgi:predicted nucleic acid-binding protein
VAFVLDVSLTAVWALADERNSLADQILQRWLNQPEDREEAFVPQIWWFELRNVLVTNERRKRLTADASSDFLRVLARFPIIVDSEPDENAIFRFARRYQLSFYDAAYLEVAHRNNLPLATLDKALKAAAEAAGVPLLA